MTHTAPKPVTGPHPGLLLTDHLRLIRALAGTTHRRGVEDLQNAAAYVEHTTAELVAAVKKARTFMVVLIDRAPEDEPEEGAYDDMEGAYGNGIDAANFETALIAKDAIREIDATIMVAEGRSVA